GARIKACGGGQHTVFLLPREDGRNNIQVVRVVVDHQYTQFPLFQPLQWNAMAQHELAEALVGNPSVAARSQAVAVYLPQVKPARNRVRGHPADGGNFAGCKYSILHSKSFPRAGLSSKRSDTTGIRVVSQQSANPL